jgi:AcrR family transcriptional regulator
MTRQLVVEAGARVVEGSGWAAMSLRAVATELGVTPMALYRHVADSETLKAAVVEVVIGQLDPVTSSHRIDEDLADWARRFHDLLSRYPGLAGHLIASWFESPATLGQIEDMLARVEASGVDGFDAVAAVNAVFTYVLMRCETERKVRSAGAVRRKLRTSAALRPLPRLTALAEHYTTAQFDTHFEFGLRSLIAGMALPPRNGQRGRTR